MPKNPSEWSIYKRDGRMFSFLDCTCDDICLGRNCIYCAFEDPERGCPSDEIEA